MQARRLAGLIALFGGLLVGHAQAQQPTFGTAPPDTARTGGENSADKRAAPTAPRPFKVPPEIAGMDSVVYRLVPASRLEVQTGKAGLFGFAGHSHLIRAQAFSGDVVYYPKAAASSHLKITVLADSLAVLTPPDTAEMRKVTQTMRSEVLHVDRYHEITLVSRAVTPTATGFHITAALTLAGQTREVPLEVAVELVPDSLRATTTFSVKQTEFGIKPYSGGPGGTVKVADRVTFDIDAVAARTNGGPVVSDQP